MVWSISGAQETLPVLSDIQYEVQADSLSRVNKPQNMTVVINCNSGDDVSAYQLHMENNSVIWTLLSVTLNGEPIWLVQSDARSDRDNVLAWNYDRQLGSLRLYPPSWETPYTLNLALRVNLLKPLDINRRETGIVVVEATTGNTRYQGSPVGEGNNIFFK
jgi:hypothetical protein